MKKQRYELLAVFMIALPLGCNNPSSDSTSTASALSGGNGQLGEIYQLEAAYHDAKTNQDIDSLMALWSDTAVLTIPGAAGSPFVGPDAIRNFFVHSGSFLFKRFSMVPAFKTKIVVNGDSAFLYFECHDIGNYDQATRFIAADAFLAGTIRKEEGRWVFGDMHAGSASPSRLIITITRRVSPFVCI